VAHDVIGDTKAAIEDWQRAAALYQQQGNQDGYTHVMNLHQAKDG